MFKKLSPVLIFIFLYPVILLSNSVSYSIETGDSLFKNRKYTQAFSIYETISDSSEKFSSQMLLKMAYIKEGLGDYTSALFYLNKFYTYNPERYVLRKMEDLAYQYKLNGYNYTDIEYFISIYNKYYYYIISAFLLSAAFIFILILLRKREKKPIGKSPILFVALLGAAYFIINYRIAPVKAIVFNSGSLLMSYPSAGSELLYVLEKGHRVPVLDDQDIWSKIEWEGQAVFIRKSDIKLVEPISSSILPEVNLFP